jgi:hypothetical protein
MILTHATSVVVGKKATWRRGASCREWRDRRRYRGGRDGGRRARADVGKLFGVKALILVHRRGVILGPTRAIVFPLPIAILILLVLLIRIGVHTMVDVGGRYVGERLEDG